MAKLAELAARGRGVPVGSARVQQGRRVLGQLALQQWQRDAQLQPAPQATGQGDVAQALVEAVAGGRALQAAGRS